MESSRQYQMIAGLIMAIAVGILLLAVMNSSVSGDFLLKILGG
jgi:hypothetical protein